MMLRPNDNDNKLVQPMSMNALKPRLWIQQRAIIGAEIFKVFVLVKEELIHDYNYKSNKSYSRKNHPKIFAYP